MRPLYKYMVALIASLFIWECGLYSQVYVKIADESVRPLAMLKSKTRSSFFRIMTKNEDFNRLLTLYKISKYEQAYPSAKSDWLLDIYVLEGNDEIYDALVSRFSREFSLVEKTDVQPMEIGDSIKRYIPNDKKYSVQSNLDLVRAPEAWSLLGNLPHTPIAVTDTHFEESHLDLQGQFINVVKTNYEDENSFHGTAVSGILGEKTDNNEGYASISFGAPIYASTKWGVDNEVLRIAQLGYRVINCSWLNRCTYSVVQDSLYSEIKNKWNAVVVFGAGNSTSHCGSLKAKVYPASYNSVLSVTSVGHVYEVGTTSSYGTINWKDCHESTIGDVTSAHHHNSAVDICAPGYHVPTTMLNSQYGGAWGTSFAAPQVASALSLIFTINPCLTADEAIDVLLSTADSSIYNIEANKEYIGQLGKGRLDVYSTVKKAIETATLTLSSPQTFQLNEEVESPYAIYVKAPFVVKAGSAVTFKTRTDVVIDSEFCVEKGGELRIDVSPDNVIVCH